MEKGKYRAKNDCRFIVGVTSIGVSIGGIVNVTRVDNEYKKVLVDFGGRNIDWIGFNSLTKNFEAIE